MTSPRYRVTWKTFLLPLIGLVAFFAYIYIFNVDIQQIFAKVQQINVSYYILATIASLFDVFFFLWHGIHC